MRLEWSLDGLPVVSTNARRQWWDQHRETRMTNQTIRRLCALGAMADAGEGFGMSVCAIGGTAAMFTLIAGATAGASPHLIPAFTVALALTVAGVVMEALAALTGGFSRWVIERQCRRRV